MSALPMHPTELDRERFRDLTKAMQFGLEYDRRLASNGDYTDPQTVAMFRLWWSVERERQLLQNLNQSQGVKLSELGGRAEKAEAELAELREQKPVTYVVDFNGYAINGRHTEIADALPTGMDLYAAPVPAVAEPAVPEEWRKVMAELADDLAIEIDQNYPPERKVYPSEQRRYEGEMEIVNRARAMLQNLNMSQGCKLSELAQKLGKAEAELAKMWEQKPLTWGTSGELIDILKNPIYSAPAPVPAVAAPAVLDVHKIEDQLLLAETEMLNAKAWAVGHQSRAHIGFAMTAISCARALLQSAEVRHD